MQPDKQAIEKEVSLFLLIESESNRFLIPIQEASEVAEYVSPKPFPVKSRGHIGVVNLHGEVVTLVSLRELFGSLAKPGAASGSERQKILMISPSSGSPIGVVCETVRKVALDVSDLASKEVVNFENEPVQVLTWDLLHESLGAA